jgi:tetratricopeptide (TPR) repeat protein
MEPGEYESLIGKSSMGNHAAAIELLHSMRLHKIHQPEITILHGARLLSNCPRKLGNDLWTVMEQVFFASVELGADEWRDYCLKSLDRQFPSSRRVERLKGIERESRQKYDEAQAIYKKVNSERPEDTFVRKRMVAMHKQRGKIKEAIDELNVYLDSFAVDAEVWHEMGELYIMAGSLSRASFCFEELMLSNPRSMYHILTYAELQYSIGDLENARKYYSLAAYLDAGSLRALWGLYICGMALAEKEKNKDPSSAGRMEELQNLTLQKLLRAYKGTEGSHSKLAVAALLGES